MNKKDNKNTKVMLARLKFAFDSAEAFMSLKPSLSLASLLVPDPEFHADRSQLGEMPAINSNSTLKERTTKNDLHLSVLCALIKQTIDAMNLLKADLCTAIPLAEQELEECLEGLEDPLP